MSSHLDNHGLYWNGKDIRELKQMADHGKDIKYIAKKLGRTDTACAQRLRDLRTYDLYMYGEDNETLISLKKRI